VQEIAAADWKEAKDWVGGLRQLTAQAVSRGPALGAQ